MHNLGLLRRQRLGAKAPLPPKWGSDESYAELLRGDSLELQSKLRRVKMYLKPTFLQGTYGRTGSGTLLLAIP
jgi:hypothetical protein